MRGIHVFNLPGLQSKKLDFLLKNSVSIAGKEKDILIAAKKLILLMSLRGFLFLSAICGFMYCTITQSNAAIPVALLGSWLALKIYLFYYTEKIKAAQCWLTYNTIKNNDISLAEALSKAEQSRITLFLIALVELALRSNQSSNQRSHYRNGPVSLSPTVIFSWVKSLLLSALEEVWDLAKHYLLPAVLIEGRSVSNVAEPLKSLRNNVPETLVGVFGIDFIGRAFKLPALLICAVVMMLAVGFAYVVAPLVPESLLFGKNGNPIVWGTINLGLLVSFTVFNLVSVATDTVKTIYFTVFYTILNRPDDLDPKKREELTEFLLNMNGSVSKQTSSQETDIKKSA